LIIEQIKSSEQAIKSEKIKNIISANKVAKEFIFKKIEEPKLKAAEEKRLAEEKAAEEKRLAEEKVAEEKRLAEEKARKEYLKTPEGQKEEKERKQKEKKRLAEEKRLKNFKPVQMTCVYLVQGNPATHKWVYNGKKINFNGLEVEISGKFEADGTSMSVKKLEGRDKFEVTISAGFVGMIFTNDFSQKSSVMEYFGQKVYGDCF